MKKGELLEGFSHESLSAEQNVELHFRRLNGDEGARLQMFNGNIGLLYTYAKRRLNHENHHYNDQVQAGRIALLEAVDTYDPSQGAFSNWAFLKITQAFKVEWQNNGRTIRLPHNIHDERKILDEASNSLEQKLERLPTAEELALETGLSVEKIRHVTRSARAIRRIDSSFVKDEPEGDNLHFILDSPTPGDHVVIKEEGREACNNLREMREFIRCRFKERHEIIFYYRFGLFGHDLISMQEIAKRIKVKSRQIVLQHLDRIFIARKFKECLKSPIEVMNAVTKIELAASAYMQTDGEIPEGFLQVVNLRN